MVRHLNPKIRTRFLEKAVPFNWALLQAVGILGLVVQCLNLARLLWGGAGLSTPASRTYCGFYLTLLALSVCFLGAKGLLNGRELETHYRVQQVLGVLFLTVEVAFGYYDIGQEASVGKIGTVTALVAFAALALMGPVYAVVSLTAAFGVMVGCVCTLGDPDAVFNYSLMGLVSLVVYLVRLRTIRTGLVRDQEMEQINRTLEETEEDLDEERELIDEGCADFRLDIMGHTNAYAEGLVHQYHLTDHVHFLGGQPYMDALRTMGTYDVLVLLEAVMKTGIFFPSKFTDYAQLGKPILAISPTDGFAHDVLTQLGGGLAVDNTSVEAIKSGLRTLVRSWQAGRLAADFDTRALYADFAPDHVVALYGNLFEALAR